MPSLHIQLLGGFRLAHDGARAVHLDSVRLQSFLAYLLLHRHAPQSRQRLAFLFWPDSTEAQARTNLRKQIYHLRRAWSHAGDFLQMDSQTLQWRHGTHFELDVAELEAALALAGAAEEKGEAQTLREALERVADLYRGELLPDCYDDWILPERERLHRAVCHALDRLLRLLERGRNYPDAVAVAQRRLHLDPLHEATYRRLMRLHALNDDPELVTQVFQQCETVLKSEMNVAPSPATRQAYESLQKRQERPQRPSPAPGTPLVGRRPEWERLMKAWRRASRGAPRFALIAGEAGVGKTRLVEELIEWAQRQSLTVAAAYCYAIEHGLIYSPVVTWLRAAPVRDFVSLLDDVWLTEIARLLPELLGRRPDLPPPEPLPEAWQRQRLYEALARALLAHPQRLLLVLEDIQWSDRETLEW
ncbi:MAG: AAA family ATPase, partial [Anaerolineae bacterium]|nr:AAA family ATPase [Anaerolineae bacterium]